MNREITETEIKRAAVMASIKSEIKADVETQKNFKNQRKTVRIKGERTINSYDAAWKSAQMKAVLREKHIVWYLIKHKVVQFDPVLKTVTFPEEYAQDKINEALDKCIPGYYSNDWNISSWTSFIYKIERQIKNWIKKYGEDEKK